MIIHRQTQKADENTSEKVGFLHTLFPPRYARLTAIIFGLLVCLSILFGIQFYYANQHNQFAVQIDMLNKLDYNIRALGHAHNSQNNQVELQIRSVKQAMQQTEPLFHALENGGTVEGIQVKALSRDIVEGDWKYILNIWQEYESSLKKDEQHHVFSHFLASVHFNDDKLRTHFDKMNLTLVNYSRQAANISRIMAVLGVLMMITSFGIYSYLVRHLDSHDQVLQHTNLELHEILDTLSEGLFLLHEDFHISMQPSKRLKNLLPQLTENGQNFLELAGDILPSTQKLSATKMFIEQLYNPRVVEKLIHSLNPLDKVEVASAHSPNDTRILGFHFTRIMDGTRIAKVLVSVKDLTDSVRIEARLQREQEQNDLQIEMISKMLNAEESIMRSFLHISLKQLAQINQILKQPNNSSSDLNDKLRLISQEIHAFKGEASMLDMSAFRLAAEAFEDMIKDMYQKRDLSGNDFIPLVTELDSLIEKLAQAEELHRKITGRLNNPMPAPTAASATDLGTILGKFVVNMGYRHNKNVIMETSGLEYLKQENESFPAVKDIIIQILRNAVVHGIEPVRARTLNGKSSEGHIKLGVLPSGGKMRITIEDDGRGIDLNALRQKAVEMKLATPQEIKNWSDNQLFSLIFRPNFSTLPEGENNEDAGRGVGMDVVRSRIKSLNGNIAIQTQAGQYTRFTIILPL